MKREDLPRKTTKVGLMSKLVTLEAIKTKVVEACYRKTADFENNFVAQKNFIERFAFAITNGDPTFQSLRDRLFKQPAKFLLSVGINANTISVFGVVFAILAALSVNTPIMFSIFVLLNLICDGLDGVVARYAKNNSDFGSILDVTCDTASLIFVSTGLVVFGKLELFLFLPYIAIILAYTYRSALKTKILDKVFLSVGSRIVAFAGLFLISLSFVISTDGDFKSSYVNILFGIILSLLSVAYFIDVARTKK